MSRTRSTVAASAALAGAALVLASCSSDSGGSSSDNAGSGDAVFTPVISPADTCDAVEVGTIGWTEDVAVNALWGYLMDESGYTWDTTNLEVGALYSGVANGDLDLFMDAWLPATHSDYWAQFGDQIDILTTWFEDAPLTWTVPAYVAEDGITSIADLAGEGDTFDGQIVGIEAGAGLTRVSMEDVMPAYGLEGEYELVQGSTAAMLAALGNAIDDGDPIVVTLWEPNSAFARWDLVNLEDPENALGDPDEIRIIASQSFAANCPNAAAALSNFEISKDGLSDLELKIEDQGESEGTLAWIEENQELVAGWFQS